MERAGSPTVVLGCWGPALSNVLGLFQVSSYASVVDAEAQEKYLRVVGAMGRKLRAVKFNGSYFDRGAQVGIRLCTPEGWFSCQVSCLPFALSCQVPAELPEERQ